MQHGATYELSVVLPFRDDEDRIGNAVRRLADHLRQLGHTFELVAVNEDSGDNSQAVLALLKNAIPELRIVAAARGRGMAIGAAEALGHSLWLIRPKAANGTLAPFSRAIRRVAGDEIDVVVVGKRFAVAKRTQVFSLLESVKGPGLYARLGRRASTRGLSVEIHKSRAGGGERRLTGETRPWTRLLEALPLRASLRDDLLERLL